MKRSSNEQRMVSGLFATPLFATRLFSTRLFATTPIFNQISTMQIMAIACQGQEQGQVYFRILSRGKKSKNCSNKRCSYEKSVAKSRRTKFSRHLSNSLNSTLSLTFLHSTFIVTSLSSIDTFPNLSIICQNLITTYQNLFTTYQN